MKGTKDGRISRRNASKEVHVRRENVDRGEFTPKTAKRQKESQVVGMKEMILPPVTSNKSERVDEGLLSEETESSNDSGRIQEDC